MPVRSNDIMAGLAVAGLILPEAVAYAAIAGLSPERAIFAGIAGGLAYALVGRSRMAIVAPTSSSAAMMAAALASLPGIGQQHDVMATVMIALVGGFFLLAGILRLGGLSSFIARPVLRGFSFGLAVTIIIKQLPKILGIPVHAPDVMRLIWALVQNLGMLNIWSLFFGTVSLVALLLLRRFTTMPGVIVILAVGIGATFLLDIPALHIAQVGTITAQLSVPVFPDMPMSLWSRLAQMALPLTLILFAESWGTMRGMALRHGDIIFADRELKALGAANLLSALVRGMPVGAGFSAGAANEAAGASTRFAALVASLALALLLAFAGPLIARIPEPILAAVVVAALSHTLSPAPLNQLWRIDRDQWVATLAAGAVILLGVLNGMLIAIGLSLIALLKRLATPTISALGRLRDTHDYVDIAIHSDAHIVAGLVILRPNAPLFFGNAERAFSEVMMRISSENGLNAVILSLEQSEDLDSSALEALVEFKNNLDSKNLQLMLARVHDPVRTLLLAAGQSDLVDRSNYSVADAVAALDV